MDNFFTRVWTDLIGRMEGPMNFRLIIQPLIACILAVRAGLQDARENTGRPVQNCAAVRRPVEERTRARRGMQRMQTVGEALRAKSTNPFSKETADAARQP